MEVEVDVYSGRENPRVTLPAAEAARLAAALRSLPPADGPWAEPDALGYRGLVIGAPMPGVTAVRIGFGRAVIIGDDGAVSWRDDSGRALERRLLDALAASLDPALADHLRDAASR